MDTSLLPPDFETFTPEQQAQVIMYISQLDSIGKKAYSIGLEHLGTSFDVLRSNGFNEWLKSLNSS